MEERTGVRTQEEAEEEPCGPQGTGGDSSVAGGNRHQYSGVGLLWGGVYEDNEI